MLSEGSRAAALSRRSFAPTRAPQAVLPAALRAGRCKAGCPAPTGRGTTYAAARKRPARGRIEGAAEWPAPLRHLPRQAASPATRVAGLNVSRSARNISGSLREGSFGTSRLELFVDSVG